MSFDPATDGPVLGRLASTALQAAAAGLTRLLGRTVVLTVASVTADGGRPWPEGQVAKADVNLVGAVNGGSVVALPAELVAALLDAPGLDDPTARSQVGEVVSELMGAVALSLSDTLGDLVDVTPPAVTVVEAAAPLAPRPADEVRVAVDVAVGDERGTLVWTLGGDLAAALVDRALSATPGPGSAHPGPAVSATPGPAAPAAPAAAVTAPVTVAPAAYPELSGSGAVSGRDLTVLSDVTLHVTVELGRTRMLVRDVLTLGEGSVVELDRSAGAPVDVLVNGTLIARGDVVVVDDELGVRISEIVSRSDATSHG